jgi:predicted ATPase
MAEPADVQLYDRSPLCTLALARYAGVEPGPLLLDEVERVTRESTYERSVFLLQPLGFIERTPARRISYEDALRFEQIHRDVYLGYGYTLIGIESADIDVRADAIEASIRSA